MKTQLRFVNSIVKLKALSVVCLLLSLTLVAKAGPTTQYLVKTENAIVYSSANKDEKVRWTVCKGDTLNGFKKKITESNMIIVTRGDQEIGYMDLDKLEELVIEGETLAADGVVSEEVAQADEEPSAFKLFLASSRVIRYILTYGMFLLLVFCFVLVHDSFQKLNINKSKHKFKLIIISFLLVSVFIRLITGIYDTTLLSVLTPHLFDAPWYLRVLNGIAFLVLTVGYCLSGYYLSSVCVDRLDEQFSFKFGLVTLALGLVVAITALLFKFETFGMTVIGITGAAQLYQIYLIIKGGRKAGKLQDAILISITYVVAFGAFASIMNAFLILFGIVLIILALNYIRQNAGEVLAAGGGAVAAAAATVTGNSEKEEESSPYTRSVKDPWGNKQNLTTNIDGTFQGDDGKTYEQDWDGTYKSVD